MYYTDRYKTFQKKLKMSTALLFGWLLYNKSTAAEVIFIVRPDSLASNHLTSHSYRKNV